MFSGGRSSSGPLNHKAGKKFGLRNGSYASIRGILFASIASIRGCGGGVPPADGRAQFWHPRRLHHKRTSDPKFQTRSPFNRCGGFYGRTL